jgi:23S rRNA pseudouridine1911/1915/1917 synthase
MKQPVNVPIPNSDSFAITAPQNATILAALRQQYAGTSWSAVRSVVRARRVAINDVLCLDEARRMAAGDVVTISAQPLPPPPTPGDVVIRFIDREIVVVEKPAGMITLRRHSELHWPLEKRQRQPTLDEAVALRIAQHAAAQQAAANSRGIRAARMPQLFSVHRLDRDTSGLIVFARNTAAQAKLIAQFAERTAVRKYLAIIPGEVASQTISTRLVRDRGDGLRGSTPDATAGQAAITHVALLRRLGEYSELECRLETGRTNQIRIHLAELGHPICGDIKYRGPLGQPPLADASRAPRLALHATQLRFAHPATGEPRQYDSAWPTDLQAWVDRLA